VKGLILEHRYLAAIFVIAVLVTVLVSAQYLKSQQLRQEMIDSQNRSYFITDTTCGHQGQNYSEQRSCPESQTCFEFEDNRSPRCVKEGFTENYCGNHSGVFVKQSRPPQIECVFKHSFERKLIETVKPVTLRISDLIGLEA
jgi:hypothetical protein